MPDDGRARRRDVIVLAMLLTKRVIAKCLRVLLAASLVAGPTAGAQSRPSFAGDWVRLDSAATSPSIAAAGDVEFRTGDMGSGWGSPLTIKQSADSLIVEFTQFSAYDLQPRLRYAYALNGLESRNGIMIGHAESMQRARVSWNGATLVIVTTHSAPIGPGGRTVNTETRQSLTMRDNGQLLIETARFGVSGGPPNIVHSVYRKR